MYYYGINITIIIIIIITIITASYIQFDCVSHEMVRVIT